MKTLLLLISLLCAAAAAEKLSSWSPEFSSYSVTIEPWCADKGLSFLLIDIVNAEVAAAYDLDRIIFSYISLGSLVKPFTLMAAAQSGVDINDWNVSCTRSTSDIPVELSCWFREGHGRVDLLGSLPLSCNKYYSELYSLVDRDCLVHAYRDHNIDVRLTTPDDADTREQRRLMIGSSPGLRFRPCEVLLAYLSFFSEQYNYEIRFSEKKGTIKHELSEATRKFNQEKYTAYYPFIYKGLVRTAIDGICTGGPAFHAGTYIKTGTTFYEEEGYIDGQKITGWVIMLYPRSRIEYALMLNISEGNGSVDAYRAALELLQNLGI